MTLLKSWGGLVVQVAAQYGGKVDAVYDLPRILGAPGIYNLKQGNNIAVECSWTDEAGRLDLALVREVMAEHLQLPPEPPWCLCGCERGRWWVPLLDAHRLDRPRAAQTRRHQFHQARNPYPPRPHDGGGLSAVPGGCRWAAPSPGCVRGPGKCLRRGEARRAPVVLSEHRLVGHLSGPTADPDKERGAVEARVSASADERPMLSVDNAADSADEVRDLIGSGRWRVSSRETARVFHVDPFSAVGGPD